MIKTHERLKINALLINGILIHDSGRTFGEAACLKATIKHPFYTETMKKWKPFYQFSCRVYFLLWTYFLKSRFWKAVVWHVKQSDTVFSFVGTESKGVWKNLNWNPCKIKFSSSMSLCNKVVVTHTCAKIFQLQGSLGCSINTCTKGVLWGLQI